MFYILRYNVLYMKKNTFKYIGKFVVKHVLLLVLIIIVCVFAYYYFTKNLFRENAEGQNPGVKTPCDEVDENGTLQISSNITEIDENGYKDCLKIIRIKIPKNITNIKNNAFRGCKNLKYIDIETDSLLNRIGDDAFADCHNLVCIFLPSKLQTITDRMFPYQRYNNGVKIYLEEYGGDDSEPAKTTEFGQIHYFIINFDLDYSLNGGEKNKIYVSLPVFNALNEKYKEIININDNLLSKEQFQLRKNLTCIASITKKDYDKAKEDNKKNMIVNKSPSPSSNSVTIDSTNLNSFAIDSIELNDKLGDRLTNKECNEQLGKIINGSEIKSIKLNIK